MGLGRDADTAERRAGATTAIQDRLVEHAVKLAVARELFRRLWRLMVDPIGFDLTLLLAT